MAVVLGISNGHDASVSVVKDGEPLVVVEKERIVRSKHAAGRLNAIIEDTLRLAGTTLERVDLVAIVPPIWPEAGYDWGLLSGTLPSGVGDIQKGRVDIHNTPVSAIFIVHHLAHASYAFYSSGRDTADVLTVDGGGGLCDASVSHWSDGALCHVRALADFRIGTLWWSLAEDLFGNAFAAGHAMGLAAYGSAGGVSELRQQYIHGHGLDTQVRFRGVRPGRLCGTDSMKWRSQVAADFAASLQQLTTELVVDIASCWQGETLARYLCLSGGVALNGYTNTALMRQAPYNECFFPNAPHDGGLSLGAALFAAQSIGDRRSSATPLSPFLGRSPSGDLESGSPMAQSTYTEMAKIIANGGVVATCRGRAELGPRALGHRSILASAQYPWMRDYLNSHVKRREPFRPLSPAIRRADVALWIEEPRSVNAYMTQIGTATQQAAQVIPSALHVDGSARAQVVEPGDFLHSLLCALGDEGQVPIVLNTSFNERGQPLCDSAEVARESARTLGVDALLLDNELYRWRSNA